MGIFKSDMARLNEEIAAGRASRQDMLGCLKKRVAALKTDVGEMLSEFGKTRSETKAQIRSDLTDFTARLQSFADDLSEQVIEMRKGFHRQRAQMLARMDDNLEQFRTSLKTEVDQIKARSSRQRAQSENRARPDMDAFDGQIHVHPRKKNVEHDKNDLTRIPGIGSHREKLFNQAGIFSFAQLAQCDPAQLRQILGKQGRLVKVKAVITHAKSMVN